MPHVCTRFSPLAVVLFLFSFGPPGQHRVILLGSGAEHPACCRLGSCYGAVPARPGRQRVLYPRGRKHLSPIPGLGRDRFSAPGTPMPLTGRLLISVTRFIPWALDRLSHIACGDHSIAARMHAFLAIGGCALSFFVRPSRPAPRHFPGTGRRASSLLPPWVMLWRSACSAAPAAGSLPRGRGISGVS